MNRGRQRKVLFTDDYDRQPFMDTSAEACQKTDWQALAWCLMHARSSYPFYLQEPLSHVACLLYRNEIDPADPNSENTLF